MGIRCKRIYDAPADSDGYRVLVDRMWPRGVAKRDATLDDWCKALAPSNDLRQWFNHDRDRWQEFCQAYRAELDACDPDTIANLCEHAADAGLTLLFAARDTEYNNAVVLKHYLEDRQ